MPAGRVCEEADSSSCCAAKISVDDGSEEATSQSELTSLLGKKTSSLQYLNISLFKSRKPHTFKMYNLRRWRALVIASDSEVPVESGTGSGVLSYEHDEPQDMIVSAV